MIDITIDYSKFETLIRIDIEYRPEQTFITAFSIGFRIDDQLFGKNDFKNQNDSQFLINEIFDKNGSKILSVDTQHKNLRQTFDLRIGSKTLDKTAISKSIDIYECRSEHNRESEAKTLFIKPIFWSTFYLNVSSLEFRTEKKDNEIFSILFDIKKYKKYVEKKRDQYLLLTIQSNLFESLTDMIEYPQIFLYENIPSFKVRATQRLYIENGKQSCIDYDSNNRPFDAISRSICLRKCYQKYCQKKFRCSPLIINAIISSIDEEENQMKFCSRELNDLCDEEINRENIKNQCIKYCPKDCIDFEVKQTNNEDFSSFHEQNKNKINTNDLKEVQIFWDKNYPLISYIETPVMSFTEYLCYCGGLLGLWFGSNAYQVISYVMDARNWISFKYNLQTFGRILLAMILRKLNILLKFISNVRNRIYGRSEW
jgi:hypothetical protein